MKNIETYLIIGMVWLAMIQNEGKIEVLVFELFIYFGIKKLLKILSSDKSKKKKNSKAKYKYESFDEGLQRIEENAKVINTTKNEEIDSAIEEAKIKVTEFKERIKSYDFREFNNRNDVKWEEVYDYLWKQCRYKGILMWNEYINELIKRGILNVSDKKEIFKKAGNYIPFKERIDLQTKFEKEKKEGLKDSQYHEDIINNMNKKVYEGMYKDGILTKEQYEEKIRPMEQNIEFLKTFNYEAYLKKKGYIS